MTWNTCDSYVVSVHYVELAINRAALYDHLLCSCTVTEEKRIPQYTERRIDHFRGHEAFEPVENIFYWQMHVYHVLFDPSDRA